MGGITNPKTNHPQPQRVTKRNQQGPNQPQATQPQEFNHIHDSQMQHDNYLQGLHNTMTYLNLPSSVQNKICGRCGLVGHLKRHCKEDVYCKYCRNPSHATSACRTYPVTSSRKNTPEKRTSNDIEREVNRRVQEEMRTILDNLKVANQATKQTEQNKEASQQHHQHIPAQGLPIQNLIGDFERPDEVCEYDQGHPSPNIQGEQNGDPILNQQWEDPPHMQPPMIPTNTPVSQQN